MYPGALAAGTLPQYNTIPPSISRSYKGDIHFVEKCFIYDVELSPWHKPEGLWSYQSYLEVISCIILRMHSAVTTQYLTNYALFIFFTLARKLPVGHGVLCTSDQLVAETCT